VVPDGEGLSYQRDVKTPRAPRSSNPSITTATYSVELTAARNGNRLYCVVTDAYGNTVQTDTVTMTIEEEALAVPELTGATAGTNGITVTWNAVDGATTYRVYRKTGSGNWISLGDLAGLSYTDAAVLSGTIYTYTVKASNGAEWSGFDEIGVTATAK
jgi:fibronectin type 3 domain-containing protein